MLIFVIVYNCVLLLNVIQELHTDFNDLGKLMIGGVGLAVVFAVALTFVRLRLREKHPQPSTFISISAQREEDKNAGR